MREGWFKLGLRITPAKTTANPLEGSFLFNKQRIAVEVLTDEHIREHVDKEASIDVFAVPRNPFYRCPPYQSLKDLKQTVCSDRCMSDGNKSCMSVDAERCTVGSSAVDDLAFM